MTQKPFGQLFLFTASPLHVDAGSTKALAALPRSAEMLPILPASSVHGALRAELRRAQARADQTADLSSSAKLLGLESPEPRHENAPLQLSEGFLLGVPLRTVRGHFVWVSHPQALTRLAESVAAAHGSTPFEVPQPAADQLLCGSECVLPITREGQSARELQMEEFTFSVTADPKVDGIAAWIASFALPQTAGMEWWREKFKHSFVIVPTELFTELAQLAAVVQVRGGLQAGGVLDRVSAREFLPADAVVAVELRSALEAGSSRDALKLLPLSLLQLGAERGVGAGITYCRTLL